METYNYFVNLNHSKPDSLRYSKFTGKRKADGFPLASKGKKIEVMPEGLSVILLDCFLMVSPSGLRQVHKTGHRQVCAWVNGADTDMNGLKIATPDGYTFTGDGSGVFTDGDISYDLADLAHLFFDRLTFNPHTGDNFIRVRPDGTTEQLPSGTHLHMVVLTPQGAFIGGGC